MTPELIAEMGRQALWQTLVLAGPGLGVILVVGVVIALGQALTQISEPTVALVPKLVALVFTLIVLGGWMMHRWVHFTTEFWIRGLALATQ